MAVEKFPSLSGVARVALLGNPNTGKSTLFNCLTGLNQKVGNYPGVTVQKKTGKMLIGRNVAEIIDLPGTYSLAADSPDERVVVDALLGELETVERPDLVLCIVDATNLQRNLYLAYQTAQLGIPMVVALNHWDSARKRNIKIDVERLSEELGVPVVPVSAARAEGVTELKRVIAESVQSRPMMKAVEWPRSVKKALEAARAELPESIRDSISDAVVHRSVFDEDRGFFLRAGASEAQASAALEAGKQSLFKGGLNPGNAETVLLYHHIKQRIEPCVTVDPSRSGSGSESIDSILTHKVWGLAAFLGLMYVVFQSVYSWAGPFMDLIDGAKGFLQDQVSSWLEGTPMLQSLATDGVVEGVGAVLIFLPQIMILFFFIALLEDTGYMARAAFLMDKLFSWCGLSGKSFVPLLSSYACAIPGVMATRTIQDPRARVITILLAPFMSCSARLPVYVLLIGAFIEPRYGAAVAGASLFAMHFVGLVVAMPFVYVANKYVLKIPPQPFVLEMPPYQIPKVRDVLMRMYNQGKEFLTNAGTVIFAITIVIWALLYFPRSESVAEETTQAFVSEVASNRSLSQEAAVALIEEEEALAQRLDKRIASAYIEQSYMGRVGKTLQPVFESAGFDWKITVGVVASFPAREVIISTLGIIYSLGGDADEESKDLRDTMAAQTWQSGEKAGQPIFTIPVVSAIMVFFALCQQCGATVAIITQETSWRHGLFSFVFMTSLAWLMATLVYQIGSRI
ncbi:ferrous iron transport protein B [Pelagicoccus sp. SDUM812003]|uniref:ferrous iron transport protein B n=1 Tax=Pelagicoccus sp. SDUM812003 TaxID=3041267 RepID=UPI00280EAE1D|nr:ferrous iron transport protein B [Pelagicoccus sp. SDUM812003]MDQ8203443.1 ferrous iron transport protein B [Pelagicoccus sp. SDUM812003]